MLILSAVASLCVKHHLPNGEGDEYIHAQAWVRTVNPKPHLTMDGISKLLQTLLMLHRSICVF